MEHGSEKGWGWGLRVSKEKWLAKYSSFIPLAYGKKFYIQIHSCFTHCPLIERRTIDNPIMIITKCKRTRTTQNCAYNDDVAPKKIMNLYKMRECLMRVGESDKWHSIDERQINQCKKKNRMYAPSTTIHTNIPLAIQYIYTSTSILNKHSLYQYVYQMESINKYQQHTSK